MLEEHIVSHDLKTAQKTMALLKDLKTILVPEDWEQAAKDLLSDYDAFFPEEAS